MFTETQQQTLDIDWFFIADDKIGFVASAGVKLPESVAVLDEKIGILSSYFRNLPEITTAHIHDELKEIKKIDEKHLADFVFMAKRGLYAFDKLVLNNFSDLKYHLVAKPETYLSLKGLPTEIIDLIHKTVYTGAIDLAKAINIEDIS
ncbi:hypothetical protein GGR22_001350 [Flavobacterium gossypii]|uniref:Uncharacterized protein n=1 Tax=Flavobacterium gossypii TaxID=1646119 RepID=A0ABR6DNH3_9FLAO|nr:hypothetical protein [Flavobacterium gossypii]MBA9073224.1 hypothetical protein [Flavobacterium gossypii]